MIYFWICIGVLIGLAWAFVLPPLFRSQPNEGPSTEKGNLPLLQEQQRQIELDLASGLLTAEKHQEALDELALRVLAEVPAAASPIAKPQAGGSWMVGTGLGLMVPVLALGIYVQLGSVQALDPTRWQASAASAPTLNELNQMVDGLAQRMRNEPQNLEGWTQLGRAYALLQRFDEARLANQHAMGISPPSAQLLTDQADVLSVLQGSNLLGEPMRLIEQALFLDPRNVKALAMSGQAALDGQDYALAITQWSRALALAPKESEWANMLESNLTQARRKAQGLDDKPAAAAGALGVAPTQAAQAQSPTPGRRVQLQGIVRLSPALADKVRPADTVFVFARAASGLRMPLAIVTAAAKDLPLQFTLDDNTAMSAQTKLSDFEQVIVGARISRTGQATPQSGDLRGQTQAISHTSQGVEITIDQMQ